MKVVAPRQITPEEASVVRNAIENAPLRTASDSLLAEIEHLAVVGVCTCGCGSRYFRATSKDDYRIADAVGRLPSGTPVHVMIWANSDHVAALELVDHRGEGKMPAPETVLSWEQYGRRFREA